MQQTGWPLNVLSDEVASEPVQVFAYELSCFEHQRGILTTLQEAPGHAQQGGRQTEANDGLKTVFIILQASHSHRRPCTAAAGIPSTCLPLTLAVLCTAGAARGLIRVESQSQRGRTP